MQRMWRVPTAVVVSLAGVCSLVGLACSLNVSGTGPADASLVDVVDVLEVGLVESSSEATPMEAGPDVSDAGMVDAVEDSPLEATSLCASLCTMEGGVCQPGPDGGEQCSIFCNAVNPCPTVQCPAGIPCFVDCTGPNACSGGVNCSTSTSCTVACAVSSNCGAIACGGSDCTVQCETPDACSGNIDCKATNSCTVQCGSPGTCAGTIQSSAQTTSVTCAGSDSCGRLITCSGTSCGVNCSGAGACAGNECCDAGSCAPRAMQACP